MYSTFNVGQTLKLFSAFFFFRATNFLFSAIHIVDLDVEEQIHFYFSFCLSLIPPTCFSSLVLFHSFSYRDQLLFVIYSCCKIVHVIGINETEKSLILRSMQQWNDLFMLVQRSRQLTVSAIQHDRLIEYLNAVKIGSCLF